MIFSILVVRTFSDDKMWVQSIFLFEFVLPKLDFTLKLFETIPDELRPAGPVLGFSVAALFVLLVEQSWSPRGHVHRPTGTPRR